MLSILLILFVNLAHSVDICQQLATYEQCIASKDDQCQWMTIFNSCMRSDNYLAGCDDTLSERICVKQIGTALGLEARCRFTNHCEEFADPHIALCTDKVTRGACLTITNPNQLCKWESDRCQTLSPDDLRFLNANFVNNLYSTSVCPRITGYLAIHSSILQPLLQYESDYITEADSLTDFENKIITEIPSKTYPEGTLQNNFINSDGEFVWFKYAEKPKPLTSQTIKLNDPARLGCIAIDIMSTDHFLQLFSLTPPIQGVNHVYCKYLATHPTNPILTVFHNFQCIAITVANLQDDSFITSKGVQCQQLEYYACQLLEVDSLRCKVLNLGHEYPCIRGSVATELPCNQRVGILANAYSCREAPGNCYLNNFQYPAYCDSSCSSDCNKSHCIKTPGLGENSDFYRIGCMPLGGCDQKGLSKDYCLKMRMPCHWDENKNKCSSVKNLSVMKCAEATTNYFCALVSRQDQFCVWVQPQARCINFADEPLYSHYTTAPSYTAFGESHYFLNRNFCNIYRPNYFVYVELSAICEESHEITLRCLDRNAPTYKADLLVDDKPCNNPNALNINKEFCLQLYNSFNRWDQYNNRCLNLSPSQAQKPCDTHKNVNAKVCSVAAIIPGTVCLYDERRKLCYTKSNHKLQCTDRGLNQDQCAQITTPGQHCQWSYGKCTAINPRNLGPYRCNALIRMNGRMCAFFTGDTGCLYDPKFQNCAISYSREKKCTGFLNPKACQDSTASCYYDYTRYECLDTTPEILGKIKCSGSNLSRTACIAVTTPGQACLWDEECKLYFTQIAISCGTYPDQNIPSCAKIATVFSNYYLDGAYCQVQNNKCIANRTQLPDCGTNQIINVHRCIAYSTGNCYFDPQQDKCNELQGPDAYQNFFLHHQLCIYTNLFLCGRVTTPGQVCWVMRRNTNIKCSLYSALIQNSCAQIIDSYNLSGDYNPDLPPNSYNINSCSLATDACYYNKNTGACAQPAPDEFLPCDTPGMSESMCKLAGMGLCVFNKNPRGCQYMGSNHSASCDQRNKLACSHFSSQMCNWNGFMCSIPWFVASCPESYSDSQFYPICSTSNDICIPRQNGCSPEFHDDLPCWLTMNQAACLQQKHFCFWANKRCQPFLNQQCSDAQTQDECLGNPNINQFCVFQNNRCFSAQKSSGFHCDQFSVVSMNYCRQFPDCYYQGTQCIDKGLSTSFNSNHELPRESDYENCEDLGSNCIFQTLAPCSYSTYQTCDPSYEFECPTMPFDSQSILGCRKHAGCYFAISVEGSPLCYKDEKKCENLSAQNCLLDLHGVACYLDGETCRTATFKTCDEVEGIQVNRQACLQASATPNECLYYSENDSCKKTKQPQHNVCEEAASTIQCALMNADCNYVYDFDTTNCFAADGTFQVDPNTNNRVSCIGLTDGWYLFDMTSYKCVKFKDITPLFECIHLNIKSCLEASHIHGFECVWAENQCQPYKKSLDSIACNSRNKRVCLQGDLVPCQWNPTDNACQDYTVSAACSADTLISPAVCTSIANCFYNDKTNTCYQMPDYRPYSFPGCVGFGLSKTECLNNTPNFNCSWDGQRCLEANLFEVKCTDEISKSSCEKVQTPGQFCKWASSKCVQIVETGKCSDFNKSLLGCRSLQNRECYYDSRYDECRDVEIQFEYCLDVLSLKSCRQVKNEVCIYKSGKCQKWESYRFTCKDIFNSHGCKISPLTCIWKEQEGCSDYIIEGKIRCKDLPKGLNWAGCTKYSQDPCSYDDELQGCTYKVQISQNQQFYNIDQTGYQQIRLTGRCSEIQDDEDCIRSRMPGQSCQWANNRCMVSNLASCKDQNLFGCVKNQSLCLWSDNTCLDWKAPLTFTLASVSLVSERVCQLFDDLKYDRERYSCVPIEGNDGCDASISKATCLKLTAQPCQYVGRCQTFVQANQLECVDYVNVSVKVCQQIKERSCRFDQNQMKCITPLKSDGCLTPGLSKLGCISIQTEACEWDGASCQPFNFISSINQCDGKKTTNAVACAQITYHRIPCSFDTRNHTCLPIFNPYSSCSAPGLNRYACFQIEREPCQYFENQCRPFEQRDLRCFQANLVNPFACRILSEDSCSYDPRSYSCTSLVTDETPCNQLGLNQDACLQNSKCTWDLDQHQCVCATLKRSETCVGAKRDTCITAPQCQYYAGECTIKRCHHLRVCEGQVNGDTCYLNHDGLCQGARSCENVIFLDATTRCDQYIFHGKTCFSNGASCTSIENLAVVCPLSDCSMTSCKLDGGICRPLQCSDISLGACTQYQGCGILGGACTKIISCSQITEVDMCRQVVVNGRPCSWEEYRILDATQHCTNQQCQLFGPSATLCNGNEINGETCMLTPDLHCISCEEVTDYCACVNSNNACTYINGKCKSNFCQSYNLQEECELQGRCYWSSKDKICRRICPQYIRQEQCEAFPEECHWNPYLRNCVQGVEVIPELKLTIQMEEEYSPLLKLFLLAWIMA